MRSLIDQYEMISHMAAAEIKRLVMANREQMGERPFLQRKMSDQQKVDAYNALRASEGGIYNFADGIRKELERRLVGVDTDTRLAKNLGPERIRWIAYTLTLKYDAEMKRLSEKTGIALVEREVLPPMPEEAGIAEWPDSTNFSLDSEPLLEEPLVEVPPLDLSFPPPPVEEPLPLELSIP